MKSFTISPTDAGIRVDKFVARVAPTLPKSLLYKSIRQKNIKRNRKRVEGSDRLCEGDVLDLYIPDEFFEPAAPRYDFLSAGPLTGIVYEDDNILLADKKQGLIVHPDQNEYRDTLIGRIQKYLYEKGEYDPSAEDAFCPALANRIDRNTGGIVLAAKNSAALRLLCDKIKRREMDKYYLAVVHGRPREMSGVLEGYLEKNEAKNQVFVVKPGTEGAKLARTRYRVLESREGLSLVEIELLTGRTHQIRAQMASIGCPLLGDGKYGKNAEDKRLGFKHQALYAYRLRFRFTTDAGELAYLNGRTFTVPRVWFAEELFDYHSDAQPEAPFSPPESDVRAGRRTTDKNDRRIP